MMKKKKEEEGNVHELQEVVLCVFVVVENEEELGVLQLWRCKWILEKRMMMKNN